MKTLIFTLITLSFSLSHAGRIDHYYRDVARVGGRPKPPPVTKRRSSRFSVALLNSQRNVKEFYPAIVKEFYLAIVKGDIKKVSDFLDTGMDPNLKHDTTGTTSLMIASNRGHKGIAKLLLDYGMGPNITNSLGMTALMHAAYSGHKAVAKLLLDYGADPNIKNSFGLTALMYASNRRHKAVEKLLLDYI